MKEYYLFLDESKPNTNFQNFTLGGVAIEKEKYELEIKPDVKKIKIDCFGSDQVILHEIDIRKKEGDFEGITKRQQSDFFNRLGHLFIDNDFLTVFAVSINLSDLDKLYKAEDRNDIYYIALQLLMENYVQFLSVHEGKGYIYLETTDDVNNAKLQNLFHLLKATGTLFVKKETLQARLHTINFAIKSENNIGLQLADFIPNALARKALGKSQKPFSIIDGINERLYDGGVGLRERFGFKIIK
ncbi:MAG: DUF3800 domain-containing protein [Lachnospiraceae bacterium]|nr:DUF3800 domain-containing protein [Lachnospiraceae bacterium]